MNANFFFVKADHELNSHMYQTVGHEGVLSIAKAMELPLFQKSTTGNVTCSSLQYECTNIDQDEVEDLTCLLFEMKVFKFVVERNFF